MQIARHRRQDTKKEFQKQARVSNHGLKEDNDENTRTSSTVALLPVCLRQRLRVLGARAGEQPVRGKAVQVSAVVPLAILRLRNIAGASV